MSTTTVPQPSRSLTRVRRAGAGIKHVLDEMAAARAVGTGRPRR